MKKRTSKGALVSNAERRCDGCGGPIPAQTEYYYDPCTGKRYHPYCALEVDGGELDSAARQPRRAQSARSRRGGASRALINKPGELG